MLMLPLRKRALGVTRLHKDNARLMRCTSVLTECQSTALVHVTNAAAAQCWREGLE